MLDAAIVGMGRWGQVLVNSVQGKNDAGVHFVAGCTRTPAKAEAWAAEKGIRMVADFESVLADPAVKAVVLATPHAQHADQVIAAAKAGKHVFIEKPFTLDRASAVAAVEACQRAGVVMALGHNRRFLPATAMMQAMIADGTLGTLLHVEGNFSGSGARAYKAGMWRADRHESPLGGMGGMGIHMIDMIINLAGRFRQVTVQSHAKVSATIDDTTAMLGVLESGASVGFATLALTATHWRVGLFGTNGILVQQGLETLTWTPVEGEGWVKQFRKIDIEAAELAAFATAIAGGAAYPLPVEDAIHGVAVFEAMIGAATSGSSYAVVG